MNYGDTLAINSPGIVSNVSEILPSKTTKTAKAPSPFYGLQSQKPSASTPIDSSTISKSYQPISLVLGVKLTENVPKPTSTAELSAPENTSNVTSISKVTVKPHPATNYLVEMKQKVIESQKRKKGELLSPIQNLSSSTADQTANKNGSPNQKASDI